MKVPTLIAHGELIIPLFSGVALTVVGLVVLIAAAIEEQTQKDERKKNRRWKIAVPGVVVLALGVVQLARFWFG